MRFKPCIFHHHYRKMSGLWEIRRQSWRRSPSPNGSKESLASSIMEGWPAVTPPPPLPSIVHRVYLTEALIQLRHYVDAVLGLSAL